MAAKNVAMKILKEVSLNARFDTLVETAEKAIKASIPVGFLSARVADALIPIINAAAKHRRCEPNDKIKYRECVEMIKRKERPQQVLEIFTMGGSRFVVKDEIEIHETPVVPISKINAPIPPASLRAEAEAITRSRGADAVFSVDDVLHAMDARFPYSKPSSRMRPVEDLKDELAVYMELDAILAETDELNPYGIAARHRIEMMKLVPPTGTEPMYFRQIRWRAQIDLFFLARAVCGKGFTNFTHRRMVEHLVQKNPKISIADQDAVKDRLTMSPRGSFKSTISVLDIAQWVCCFPDELRCVVVTSVAKLAKRFIGELKQYFIKAEGAQPTTFQQLFPELVIDPSKDGKSAEFTVKDRKSGLKDPTVWAAAVSTDEVGSHCDLLIFDDAQSVENCGTPETMESLQYKISMLKALLDPGGYRQFIGTPLAPGDLYFSMKNNLEGLKILYEPAMTRKPGSLSKDEADCQEEDFTLLFPERLTWDFLQSVKKENLGIYRSQYLLDPRGETEVTFPIELLVTQTIHQSQIPDRVTHAIAFDLAYTANTKSDETVGAVAAIDIQGRTFIKKIIHGRFTPTEIADEIVSAFIEFHPLQIVIEASNGAMILESIIRQMAEKRGVTDHIPLVFQKVDNKRGAKTSRISVLETLLRRSLLFFSQEIDCLDELYKQFTEFGVTRHDDLPDAISLLYAAGVAKLVSAPPDPAVEQQMLKDRSYQAFYDAIYPDRPIVPELKLEEEFFPEDLFDPYTVVGISSGPKPAGR